MSFVGSPDMLYPLLNNSLNPRSLPLSAHLCSFYSFIFIILLIQYLIFYFLQYTQKIIRLSRVTTDSFHLTPSAVVSVGADIAASTSGV